jgi:hypothetical protein
VAAVTRAIHGLVRETHSPAILGLFIPFWRGLRRPRTKPGPLLKAPIKYFESFNRVEQLQACLKHLVRTSSKLLSVLDSEFDPINSCARLVRHFEFEG